MNLKIDKKKNSEVYENKLARYSIFQLNEIELNKNIEIIEEEGNYEINDKYKNKDKDKDFYIKNFNFDLSKSKFNKLFKLNNI